jgi:hypothetical protein
MAMTTATAAMAVAMAMAGMHMNSHPSLLNEVFLGLHSTSLDGTQWHRFCGLGHNDQPDSTAPPHRIALSMLRRLSSFMGLLLV